METAASEQIPAEAEQIGRRVIGAAMEVHRNIGPGYKESIYVEAMCLELDARGLKFEREKSIPVTYRNVEVGRHRLDFLIEQVLVVERKSIEAIAKLHTRQIASYLKASKLRLGFIFNFNVDVLMPAGFDRVIL